jgi:hypothetical protein
MSKAVSQALTAPAGVSMQTCLTPKQKWVKRNVPKRNPQQHIKNRKEVCRKPIQ